MKTEKAALSAHALALQIPSARPVTVQSRRPDEPPSLPIAISATFVGQSSAELTLAITESDLLAAGLSSETFSLSPAELLKPALEAACTPLGAGVLGEVRSDAPARLLIDPLADVFELKAEGESIGWFAIRMLAAPEPTGASAPRDDDTARRLARINNVTMTLAVEIGRTRMSVRDALTIEPGTVVELDRSAGAPADIMLNGRLIARGEVVVVDQDYAVRVTSIIDGSEGFV